MNRLLSWRSCKSPVAHSCGLLNHLNSFHRRMFKLNTKSDADLLLYCLSHVECDSHTVHMLNGVYCPYWLVQWSHHCSCMCIPVHSPWLPGYIDISQTVFIMLTMAGHFPDRPRHILLLPKLQLKQVTRPSLPSMGSKYTFPTGRSTANHLVTSENT